MNTIAVSVVIPTRDRPAALARAMASLMASTLVPDEFVIVDASDNIHAVETGADGPRIVVQRAITAGAAAQRNQAVALAGNDFILFCDDDIIAEPDCIEHLWRALQSDLGLGGASAAIVNQHYRRPGPMMRLVLRLIGGPEGETYAGRIVGPAVAFLPELNATGAAVPVQWLNLGCTLYRKAVLPDPPFDTSFEGYSIGEDMALSLQVAKRARLVNVPAARIFHDSQPGAHKADDMILSRMALVNRHFIMTQVMGKRGVADVARLLLWEVWQLAICAWQQRGGAPFWRRAAGSMLAVRDMARRRSRQ